MGAPHAESAQEGELPKFPEFHGDTPSLHARPRHVPPWPPPCRPSGGPEMVRGAIPRSGPSRGRRLQECFDRSSGRESHVADLMRTPLRIWDPANPQGFWGISTTGEDPV